MLVSFLHSQGHWCCRVKCAARSSSKSRCRARSWSSSNLPRLTKAVALSLPGKSLGNDYVHPFSMVLPWFSYDLSHVPIDFPIFLNIYLSNHLVFLWFFICPISFPTWNDQRVTCMAPFPYQKSSAPEVLHLLAILLAALQLQLAWWRSSRIAMIAMNAMNHGDPMGKSRNTA